MKCLRLRSAACVAIFVLIAGVAQAGNPFRYPEAKHGKGELRYVNGTPILLVQGSPDEIGDQVGELALKQLADLHKKWGNQFLGERGIAALTALAFKAGNVMLPQFPPDHIRELDAAAKASGWPRDMFIFGNTYADMRKMHNCSALIVEPLRSTTGAPLFGRNVDEYTAMPLYEYTIVTVFRPTGKHAFASIGYPGMIGCCSGINDAGLALAGLTVTSAADGSPSLDVMGTPQLLMLRRVLEECSTIEEAEKLIRSTRRTTMENFAFCDERHGAVFEVTTKTLVVRPSVEGVCPCTNHFRSRQLATDMTCDRYTVLEQSRGINRLALGDVIEKLSEVAGEATLQSMVFEPALLRLHLAFGPGPASDLPLRQLDLSTLLAKGEFPTDVAATPVDPVRKPPRITKLGDGRYRVEFRYRPVHHVGSVYLAGTFNKWKPTAKKMLGPDESGAYQTSIELDAGHYEYKFVIESKKWRRDPNNETVVGPDRNSVIEVGR